MKKFSDHSEEEIPDSQGETVGIMLKKGRIASRVDVNDLCKRVRISREQLDALENGRYDKLPSDPYVRAFLGTLSRILNIDTQALLDHYARETGQVQVNRVSGEEGDEPASKSGMRTGLIVAIIAGFLLLLLFQTVNRRLNRDIETPITDSVLVPEDSALDGSILNLEPEYDSLADTGSYLEESDSGHNGATPGEVGSQTDRPLSEEDPDISSADDPDPADQLAVSGGNGTTGNTFAHLKAIVDTVWVRAVRPGKPDFNKLLTKGKGVRIKHHDTIFITAGITKSLEVTTRAGTSVPGERKFKVFGTRIASD